jgi:hypothetical protein
MDGQRLFTSAYVTLSAYDAGTGAQLWVVCLDVDDDGVDADSPGAVRIGDGVVCYWTPGGARCVDAASGARLDGREVVGPQAEDGGRCFGAGANVELRACFGDMTLVNAHLGLRSLSARGARLAPAARRAALRRSTLNTQRRRGTRPAPPPASLTGITEFVPEPQGPLRHRVGTGRRAEGSAAGHGVRGPRPEPEVDRSRLPAPPPGTVRGGGGGSTPVPIGGPGVIQYEPRRHAPGRADRPERARGADRRGP